MGNLFLTAGGLCLICLFMIFVIPYQFVEQKGKRAGKKMTFSDFFAKELLIYVFLIGLFSFGNGIISYYLINFGEVRGIANIALFFTVYSVAMLIMTVSYTHLISPCRNQKQPADPILCR